LQIYWKCAFLTGFILLSEWISMHFAVQYFDDDLVIKMKALTADKNYEINRE